MASYTARISTPSHGRQHHPGVEYALWIIWVAARYTLLGYPLRWIHAGVRHGTRSLWRATQRLGDTALGTVETILADDRLRPRFAIVGAFIAAISASVIYLW
jgi:hypothetical protein